MFIESWQIAVVIIWLIYLLYRTSVWSNKVQTITSQYDELLKQCTREKYQRTSDLSKVILRFNQRVLKKAPKRTRDSILEDEAKYIVSAIRNNNRCTYDYSPALQIEEIFSTYSIRVLDPEEEDKINPRELANLLKDRLEELIDEYSEE